MEMVMKAFEPAFFVPILRHIAQFGAGYLVAQGIIDEDTATQLVGGAIALFTVAWYFMTKPSQKAVVAAEAVDTGKTVTIAAEPKQVINK